RENIDVRILTELMRLHCLKGYGQGHFIGKRSTPQVIVKQTLRRFTSNGVRKYRVLPIPLAIDVVGPGVSLVKSGVGKQPGPHPACILISHVTTVPGQKPSWCFRHVIGARDEIVTGCLVPVRSIAATYGHQYG